MKIFAESCYVSGEGSLIVMWLLDLIIIGNFSKIVTFIASRQEHSLKLLSFYDCCLFKIVTFSF